MTNLFFYGSLRDDALLDIVMGAACTATRTPGTLADHAVSWAKGHEFPMIHPAPGETANGVLVEGLSDTDIARLNFYEGGFDYDLRPMQAQTAQGTRDCQVYWPPEGAFQPGAPWLLGDWQDQVGAISRVAAQEVMGYFGTIPAEEVERRFPMIRRRAASRLRAGATQLPAQERSPMTLDDVQIHRRDRVHGRFFAYDVMELQHKRFDGTPSEIVNREIFVGCDAVIVLPYDPKTDRVLMVEQFRTGPTGRGDPSPWCLEPVAGLVDPYETPEQAAKREAVEEGGVTLHRLEKIAQGYASPGASTEHFTLYIGLCDLPEPTKGSGGLDEEHEDIRTHILPFDRALHLADSGEINVIPTQLCLNWLARHHARLRGTA